MKHAGNTVDESPLHIYREKVEGRRDTAAAPNQMLYLYKTNAGLKGTPAQLTDVERPSTNSWRDVNIAASSVRSIDEYRAPAHK